MGGHRSSASLIAQRPPFENVSDSHADDSELISGMFTGTRQGRMRIPLQAARKVSIASKHQKPIQVLDSLNSGKTPLEVNETGMEARFGPNPFLVDNSHDDIDKVGSVEILAESAQNYYETNHALVLSPF